MLLEAEAGAEDIDTDFLLEVSPEQEFGFDELAADDSGHKPGPAESAAVLLRLHSAPIYFHRKGKGRFARPRRKFFRRPWPDWKRKNSRPR